MGWWDTAWRQKAEDWTYDRLEPANTPMKETVRIEAEKHYITARLASLRVVNVRKVLTRFYGAVHSYISLAYRGGTNAEFNVFTTPARLKDLDAANIDNVIQVDIPLLKSVPYRGDDIELEIGLFSIASQDLAAPFLSLLETISKLAGVSYVSTALTFAEPLKKGIGLITGSSGPNVLEVGLRANLTEPRTGYYAVIRAPKESIDVSQLHISGPDERLVDAAGRPLQDFPYMVLRIDAAREREAFFKIPELSRAYNELNAAIRSGDVEKSRELLALFRRTVLTSDDLLFADAQRLYAMVEKMVNDTLGPPPVAAAPVAPQPFSLPGNERGAREGARQELPRLEDLALFH